MIQNVHQNYEGYTKRDVKEAILARKAQSKLGNTSHKEFMKVVSSKPGVKSIPIKPHSITNALAIYGHDLAVV